METPECLSSITGISHLKVPYESHSSEIWVDLAKFYDFIKEKHSENDKTGVPRRNNFQAEISKYGFGVEEREKSTYLSIGAILRYCFYHSDNFSICKDIVDDTTKRLIGRKLDSDVCRDSVKDSQYDSIAKTTFQLYKEIACSMDTVTIGGNNIKELNLKDSKIESLDLSYKSAFLINEWKRIQLFEFQFSAMEKEKRKYEKSPTYRSSVENKWSFWESVKTGMAFRDNIQKLNSRVCSYQRDRMKTAEAIEGVSLCVGRVQHLPTVIEGSISAGILEYHIKGIGTIISVDCSEICDHNGGIHIFLEANIAASETVFSDISTIVRASLRSHVEVKEIVFLKPSALLQFCTDTEVARFTMRDKNLQKKLNDEILHVDKIEGDYNICVPDEEEHQLCRIYYKPFSDWLDYPLSISSHDPLCEWLLFVPLPVRMFLEKAFLNTSSLKYSPNELVLIRSKVPRLSSIYEACLNTFNKNYFGPSQEMNTADLIVNYSNATTVFGIAQSSGFSMSLISAEKKLKKQANKERLYFQTYIKRHPLEYETIAYNASQTHSVSLRDCHLIFLVDNLVRTQKKRDPETARMKSIQLCTLPITVKGLPRNSKITDSWHSDNCDGSDSCRCKDSSQIAKNDIFDTFISYTKEEETQLLLFRNEAIWGLNFLLQDSLVRPIMNAAAEIHKPVTTCETAAEDLTISFHDMSLREVNKIGAIDQDLEISISGMSLGDETGNVEDGDIEDDDDDHHHHYDDAGAADDDDDDDDEEEKEEEEEDDLNFNHVSDWQPFQSDSKVSRSQFEVTQQVSSENQLTKSTGANSSHPDFYKPEYENDTEAYLSEFENDTYTYLYHFMSIEDENGTDLSSASVGNNISSFIKYEVPALLCRHPPPAVGKDDDIRVLRNVLDELIVKSGHFMHPKPNKEKILLAPDHKIANNVFSLMEEPQFKCLLPEFPVLHLLKSKITNLISAYEPAGIRGLLKYMKDDEEETDWKKLVSLAEIESAARNIRRLSLSLHISIFAMYVESLAPIESDNLLGELKSLSLQEAETRWGNSYDGFIQQACANNATFRMHLEIMNHCDEIVGIQLAERIGGQQGYNLLLALVKTSLPFSFLNGASSYAGFCVKLLYEHYKSSFFHKRMKEALLTTPHKEFASNFALDAQREMDHRDAIKSFRSSASIESIPPRMSVMDDLQAIRKARSSIYKTTNRTTKSKDQANHYLGKTISEKDIRFVSRCAQMILRKDVLSTANDSIPKNVYQKNPQPLSKCILDSETKEVGHFLIKKFICKAKLGGTDACDCPDVKDIQGPSELIQRVKLSKGTTIQRHRIKPNVQKSEKELTEEKRIKEMKKLNKLTMHCSSVMNTCQAIVNPDCSKPNSNKSKAMRDAIVYVLSRRKEKETPPPSKETVAVKTDRRSRQLQADGLIYFQCSTVPKKASENVIIVTIEFAGVKFWAFATSGREFLNLIQKKVFSSIFKEFKNIHHMIICEEKYSFTPDTFKALTREKRNTMETVDISHLKSSEEMISMDTYSRSALTKTSEGKKLASCFLAANVTELTLNRKCIIDIDSEYLLSECVCTERSTHATSPCRQHAIPVRAIFGEDGVHVESKELHSIRQRKGEAELAQADWLPFIVPELDEDDAVLSYVTSGDIDALPIHILAVSEFWPRLPNRKFRKKKPKKNSYPDIYCITRIVETLESDCDNRDIGAIVAFILCLGGNDYIPKFYGISHLQWMATIIEDKVYCENLFTIVRHRQTHAIEHVTLNDEVYVSILKDIYCPKHVCGGKLTYEEVRQMSIKLPGKEVKNPQQWLPPLSAIKKVVCLVQSQIDYLLTVCKPEADLPDFVGTGGLRRTREGDIVYDLGADVRYNNENELTTIPEDVLQQRIRNASRITRQPKKKRDLSESPQKEDGGRGTKRTPSTSTPRKIRDLKVKQHVSFAEKEIEDSNQDDMDGFQPIDEETEDIEL